MAWLLGRQLMGSLKGTLLYTAFGNKIDPRDWMEARSFDYDPPKDGGAFWFDYISDTGDGMRATYSIAYLSLSDLWVKQLWEKKPPGSAKAARQKDNDASVKLQSEPGFAERLPRGAFLFVGGDTTYHLSDYSSLANRFQHPFMWAFKDLALASDETESPRRPLYGIPGNHDYYDLLDGFRRQFRHPVREEKESTDDQSKSAQLIIPGFRRQQEASYLAIRLPWDWWLWGLDTELGAIDERQLKFFKDRNNKKTPDKLIVATCAPTTVFGKYARWEDKKSAQTFFQLRLPWLFWEGNQRKEEMKREIKEELEQEMPEEKVKTVCETLETLLSTSLEDGQCRLDIAGDVHHYARYWGPETDDDKPRPKRAKGYLGHNNHYASVMSGLGGAFHHPSYTYVDEVQEQVLYPSSKDSLMAVADRIFNPVNIIKGGSVWLLGFIIAFVIYFGTTIPKSSRQSFNNFFFEIGLSTSQQEGTEPTVLPLPSSTPQVMVIEPNGTTSPLPPDKIAYLQDRPDYYDGLTGFKEHPRYLWGVLLLLLSLIAVGTAAVMSKRMFGVRPVKLPDEADFKKGAGTAAERNARNRVRQEAEKKARAARQIKLWVFVLVVALFVGFGFYLLRPLQRHITPFGSSLLVLYSLMMGVAAFTFCIHYSEWLFEKAYTDYVTKWDWSLVQIVSVLGVVGVASGLWFFGKYNAPVFVLTDILFVLVLLLMFFGLIALAWFKGGEMLENIWDKAQIAIVGIWHAVLQIAVPFLMVRKGTWLTWLAAIVVSIFAFYFGRRAMRENRHISLSVSWFVYGAAMLALPFLIPDTIWGDRVSPQGLIYSLLDNNWAEFVCAVLAGLIGALMSCVWFGWYLAVCFLTFHGHNNEVGGAGRIENFKQFIRFRLTEDSLTGYVIAVDEVSEIGKPVLDKNGEEIKVDDKVLRKDGSYLKPRLIDVFQLTVKGSAAAQRQAETAVESLPSVKDR